MPRTTRHIESRPQGTLVEVCTRTLHGAYLLPPTADFVDIAVGCLGRALEVSPLEPCAISMLSNHYHGLFNAQDQQQLSRFMGHFNGNLAREVGRYVDWPEKIWARRYSGIVVSDEPEDQWQRLKYVLSQGTKEHLVESPLEWEGLHAARPLLEGGHLSGHWFNRTEEWKARRRGETFQKYDYATEYRVEFAPLPAYRHLPQTEYYQMIDELIEEIESEAREARGETKTVVGMPGVQARGLQHRPQRFRGSPQPRFHAADRDTYLGMVAADREFRADYRAAAEKSKASGYASEVGFPSGCYPPALPFVGALHEPKTPPPPPTRSLVRDEDGRVISRGEIPVFVVSGRSPPSQDPSP